MQQQGRQQQRQGQQRPSAAAALLGQDAQDDLQGWYPEQDQLGCEQLQLGELPMEAYGSYGHNGQQFGYASRDDGSSSSSISFACAAVSQEMALLQWKQHDEEFEAWAANQARGEQGRKHVALAAVTSGALNCLAQPTPQSFVHKAEPALGMTTRARAMAKLLDQQQAEEAQPAREPPMPQIMPKRRGRPPASSKGPEQQLSQPAGAGGGSSSSSSVEVTDMTIRDERPRTLPSSFQLKARPSLMILTADEFSAEMARALKRCGGAAALFMSPNAQELLRVCALQAGSKMG
jgi:hypothetical protein